jgi:transcriptional regulator with XRE-family HTH domain
MVTPRRQASAISRAVGDVILGRYKRLRLSQADLSERTGISVTTMRRLIAGEAEFDVDQLFVIASTLGVSAADILREAEDEVLAGVVKRGLVGLPRAATQDPELDSSEPGAP